MFKLVLSGYVLHYFTEFIYRTIICLFSHTFTTNSHTLSLDKCLSKADKALGFINSLKDTNQLVDIGLCARRIQCCLHRTAPRSSYRGCRPRWCTGRRGCSVWDVSWSQSDTPSGSALPPGWDTRRCQCLVAALVTTRTCWLGCKVQVRDKFCTFRLHKLI